MKSISFIINTSEITAGTRGASLGPDAILTAARTQKNTFFSNYSISRIPDRNYLLDQQSKFNFAKNADGLVAIYEDLTKVVSESLKANQFPFVIAADHGSAGGTIAGIKAAFPDKKLGVVWIDAHGDLHSPYTTPSGNMHGMPLATALADDNMECSKNKLTDEEFKLWERLKNMADVSPKITPENLVFVGLRDLEKEEVALMERLNIKQYTVEQVRNEGAKVIANKINSDLAHCDIVYVSYDVDVMDPELISYGTGTPVLGGLSDAESIDLLSELASNEKLVCMELVEVNPCLDDKKNKMAETAFDIIQTITKKLEK